MKSLIKSKFMLALLLMVIFVSCKNNKSNSENGSYGTESSDTNQMQTDTANQMQTDSAGTTIDSTTTSEKGTGTTVPGGSEDNPTAGKRGQ